MIDTEIIEVVAAHAAGKKIEYSWGRNVNWFTFRVECGDNWNFSKYTYRVASEPEYLKGYCFPKDIFTGDAPCVGMIKVQQVELEKGENPLPRNPR
jgi:hypothetical protein